MSDDSGRPARRKTYDGRSDPAEIRPDDEEYAAGPGGPSRGVVLRAFSVLPFVLVSAIGLIAIVSWVLIVIFGVGGGDPVWVALQGLSTGRLIGQIALAVAIGLTPVVVTVAASWATARGFRPDSSRQFWIVTQGVWGILAIGLIYMEHMRHDSLDEIGLGATDWWFAFGVVAFAMIMAGVRLRAAPRPNQEDGRP